ncbi:MAG: MmgE/PrpD family protein [Burkholderiales bacterium]|nr:MmgE/PrpD family protein [Burkholderiales bacterium]
MTTVAFSLASICARSVDGAARERAALHVQDWLGCAAAGVREAVSTPLAAWAATRPRGPAALLTGSRADMLDACLINGALGNPLEMDDVHRAAILHPGPVVIPAALAVGETIGAAADDVLAAIVRGYEAMIRVGVAAGPGHYAYWHPTATCGVFGAAVAAASLLRLSTPMTVAALGNAGTQAAGLWQVRHEDVMAKQLHTAHAAHAGVLAADWARHGFSGVTTLLEGPQGFFAALGGGDPARVAAEPDAGWKIFEVSFKPWPACRHAHPLIDAALALRETLPADAIAAIDTVEVRAYADAIKFCDRPDPATALQAKFSLQHCAATVLLHGPPALAHFEPSALAEPRVAALRARVRVASAEPYASAYPAHFGAALTVCTQGRAYEHAVTDALGDPENPLSRPAIDAKARTLMQHALWSAGRIDAALAACRNLPGAASLDALTATFHP